jgi:hypothetical protein
MLIMSEFGDSGVAASICAASEAEHFLMGSAGLLHAWSFPVMLQLMKIRNYVTLKFIL